MNNPLLVELIAVRMDNDTLGLVSQTSLWEIVGPLLKNQHFWFLRTQALVNFDLEWEKNESETSLRGSIETSLRGSIENWHQVYDIILSAREINPFSMRGPLANPENKYNLTAVKILLKLGYDPSVYGTNALYDAARYGSPEVVQLLLSDSRILIHSSSVELLASISGGRSGRLDVMKVLLSDPRIQKNNPIPDIIRAAVVAENLEYIKFLMPQVNASVLEISLETAMRMNRYKSIIILLQDQRIDISQQLGEKILKMMVGDNHADGVRILLQNKKLIFSSQQIIKSLEAAIKNQNVEILRLFLEDSRTGRESKTYLLKLLDGDIRRGRVDRVDLLVKTGGLDLEITGDEYLKFSINAQHPGVIEALLQDERIDKSSKLALSALNSPKEYVDEVIEALLRKKHLDFRDISSAAMDYITDIDEHNDSLQGGILLGGKEATRDVILGELRENRSFYNLLLKEVMFKRLDLEYYLTWILKELGKNSTRPRVRRLLSSAARSMLSDASPVHTSASFSAYRGFMLLTVSDDGRMIMNTLSGEEASREGLILAGILVGSFLGREKIRETS